MSFNVGESPWISRGNFDFHGSDLVSSQFHDNYLGGTKGPYMVWTGILGQTADREENSIAQTARASLGLFGVRDSAGRIISPMAASDRILAS